MKRILLIGIIGMIIIFSFSACGNLSGIYNKKDAQKVNVVSNVTPHPKEKKPVSPPPRSVLRAGDKGDDVKDIQKKLKKFGYSVNEDGDFGEETVYAVMDFQHRHGLTTDGVVGGTTLEDLKKKPVAEVMYKPTAQVVSGFNSTYSEGIVNKLDTQSYTDYYIMVSIPEQMVYIFNGSIHKWKLINSFQCSSGTGGTPTVKGQFFVGIKGSQFESENGAILKYFTQFQGNYLFHSVLFDKNGNLVDGTLGRSASHGCIRLALENAKYIYDNVPIGSGILIQ
ncbi:L,D-transpeptidase family protein [Clostridium luticellarii]|jgi:lipoprotein-anchoring transpeptidase ErfK/SrfK|uniref:Putative L,D-transpeptidase YciB n=1 Tax=Clostridium luticellarii TaxID=1691940 RepID=A0A2T0BSE1_9CLOT|nr:L,D-transpeptidase family protein [Clostridium luticellarii]MCI1945565.1 L,D-transpeptidase family protein [Clostridium luticellarii]MCI1968876.1 L,D-transpeptidase family protein [Clostridium luticellarii]MCI1996509.1 L,D-transpeptidase family protein [Clostridium luticellarii]MCI2041049.1 L,D-transpeptidase family protein [Clostridium luticellarii]PRR86780.1 putative L,D-transpeptidase YciB precursor [Clostridium luticellarii]